MKTHAYSLKNGLLSSDNFFGGDGDDEDLMVHNAESSKLHVPYLM
jgi:hypothetical protein